MSRGTTGTVHLPPGERRALLSEVEKCEKDVETASKAGDQQQLLKNLELGLYLRRRLYAESSPEVAEACRQLCEASNRVATAMLQRGETKAAHDLLKLAEQVAEKNDLDRAITWNNLACYYRRVGKLRAAVNYLERALAIEEHLQNSDATQTHLNLCATLSQLKRHGDALYHAQRALIRVYEVLAPGMLAGEISLAETSTSLPDLRREQITVLCVAYHNLAVEHEYLKNCDAALSAYAEGLRWATKFLPEGHQMAGILKSSVDAVKVKLRPSSGALARAAELAEGWGTINPHKDRSSPGEGTGRPLDHLLTPRAPGDDKTASELEGGLSKEQSRQGTYSSMVDSDSGSEEER